MSPSCSASGTGCPLPSGIAALPIALWEFSLGVYLIVKGFKPSPITAGMTVAARQHPACQARQQTSTAPRQET